MAVDTPQGKAPLTNYGSRINKLLTWENPRDSAVAYASIVSLIAITRYVDVIRYAFKLTWLTLGVTLAAEVASKAIINKGLMTQLRPRSYFQISQDTTESIIGDIHGLFNFFVIEAQRIAYVENVCASSLAFVAAFISYFLVKVVPYWALTITATTLAFFTPLAYKTNKELIDHYLKELAEIVNAQTEQLRKATNKQTTQLASLTKQYMGDYTAKAQSMIRAHTGSPEMAQVSKAAVKETDFPEAPKGEFASEQPSAEKEAIPA